MSVRDDLRRRAVKAVKDLARRGRVRQDGRDGDGRDEATAERHEKARRLRAKARKDEMQPKTAAEHEYFVDDDTERRR